MEPDGVSVRYVNAFPATDLVYQVNGGGVEEFIVVKSAAGVPNVTFSFAGLQFDKKSDRLEGRGKGLGKKIRLSAPWSFDAKQRQVDRSNHVFDTVDDGPGKSKVRVGVTSEFLASLTADAFPLTIDPNTAVVLNSPAPTVTSYSYNVTNGAQYSISDGQARIGGYANERWQSVATFNYASYMGASVVNAKLTTSVNAGASAGGTSDLDVYWADTYGFHDVNNPRQHHTIDGFWDGKPDGAYDTNPTSWSSPYFSTQITSGVQGHPTSVKLGSLYNAWTRTGITGGAVLLVGDESSGTTLKTMGLTMELTINRWPSTPTAPPATASITDGTRDANWANVTSTDPDGDTLGIWFRAEADLDGNGVVGEPGEVAQNAFGASSWSTTLPAAFSWKNVHLQAFATDNVYNFREIHDSGMVDLGWFRAVNRQAPAPTLTSPSPASGSSGHAVQVTLAATPVTDPDGDSIQYRFFQCNDTATPCVTRLYFDPDPNAAWQTPNGGSPWTQTVTLNPTPGSPSQTIRWGIEVRDGIIDPAFPISPGTPQNVVHPNNMTTSPMWTYTFTNAEPTVALGSPLNGALVNKPFPVLTASVADSDDLSLNYRFEVTPASGTGVLVSCGPTSVTQASLGAGVAVSCALPDWLESKAGYQWKVIATDAGGRVATSAIRALKTQTRLGADSAAPIQSAGPVSINLATGNLFFAVGSAKSVATVGGPMSVSMSYNSQDTSMLGLRGSYYVDTNTNGLPDTGEVKMTRTDSMPSFKWATGTPAESVPASGFSAQWVGYLRIPSGMDGNWTFAGGGEGTTKISLVKAGVTSVNYNRTTNLALGDPNVFGAATPIALTSSDLIKVIVDYKKTGTNASLEFRAKRTSDPGETQVSSNWFSVSADQALPVGWTLSADTGIDPVWTRAEINEDSLTLTSPDGSQTAFSKKTGAGGVVSWAPPGEVDDTVAVNADGTITVFGGDGLVYQFSNSGVLVEVITSADDLKPAGARRVYNAGTDATGVARLYRLEDRLQATGATTATRSLKLYYNQPGIDSGCPANLLGYDPAAPAGMLCAIHYPDNTRTKLYYSNGMLSRISDPGDDTAATNAPAAVEGRIVTDMVWNNGQLSYIVTPLENDRNRSESTMLAAERIGTANLRTDIAWNTTSAYTAKTTVVTLAKPNTTAARPAFTIGYPTATSSTVTIAGIAGVSRTVTFDEAGRILTNTDAVGRVASTTWAPNTDAILKTAAGGRTTSTVYDAQWHPVDVHGPAASTCFPTAAPPQGSEYLSYPPSSCAGAVPKTHTDYDHNLQGLQGAYWSTNNFTRVASIDRITSGHGMGPNVANNVDYTWPNGTNPPGVTNADNWTARFTGIINNPTAGNYIFRLVSGTTDSATLYINDVAQVTTAAALNDNSSGSITFPATAPIRIRIDLKAGTGTSSLKFGWGLNGAATNFTIGSQVKPGFWYATRATTSDTTGSTQVPATSVTETVYDVNVLDPVYGIPTATTLDPTGLNLKTGESFEALTATSMLRRTMRTLPAFAGAASAANSTTYSYYADTATAADPCVAGSTAQPQVGLLQFTQGPAPAAGTAVKTETVYDILGRPVATRYAGDTAWTCTSYDARGRVWQIKIPANATTAAGRTITTTYKVDGDSLKTSVADSAGTITTTVDALGRTVTTVDVWGVTTNSTYDQAGRLTQAVTTIASPAYTATSTYSYDNANRLTSQKLDGNTLATLIYSSDTATLDPGNLTGITYPSGAGNAGNGTKGTIGYDGLGRINALTWQTTTNTLITSDAVTRSLTGKVLTATVDGAGTPAWTYTYDGAGRLTRAVGSGHNYQYAYAATGGCGANTAAGKNTNRTTLTDNAVAVANYCYDNADRLTSTTQPSYTTAITYDAHGNTIGLAGETYGYDYADRHTTTTKAGVRSVAYTRDLTNRIVSRTDTNLATTAAVTQRYGYTGPGDSSSLTLTTTNAVSETVISLPGGVNYTKRTASPVWSYPNIHGDTQATANGTGVKQGGSLLYSPFGDALNSIPDNLTGDFDNGWLGQPQRRTERATGLNTDIEMGARIYTPTLGRFLQVDPVDGGTDNDYAYVTDPINAFDLDGRLGGGVNYKHAAEQKQKRLSCRTSKSVRCHPPIKPGFLKATGQWIGKHKGAIATGFSVLAILGCGPACAAVAVGLNAWGAVQDCAAGARFKCVVGVASVAVGAGGLAAGAAGRMANSAGRFVNGGPVRRFLFDGAGDELLSFGARAEQVSSGSDFVGFGLDGVSHTNQYLLGN